MPASSRKPRRLAVAALGSSLLALLAACEVGPDFAKPAPPETASFTPEPLPPATASAPDIPGGVSQRFLEAQDIPGQWWELFHSAALNALIEQAIKANPSLDAAKAALRVAQENVYAGEGAMYPTVDASFEPSRQKITGAAFGFPGASSVFSLVTAQVSVAYSIDAFGGTRRQIESLEAQRDYERFQVEAAYLTLTDNLVAAAVQEASLRAQIAATQDIVELETKELKLVQNQFELGGISKAAVLLQEANLAQIRATLPVLRKQLAQQRDLIAALAGKFPSQEPVEKFDLATLQLPADLPLTLPSQLVEQRPDVRAAESQLHSASAQIGVALANELPQLSISAQYGSSAIDFASLFTPGTAVWAIAGTVSQKLFDGFTLLHKRRAADAAFDEAAAQYRATVLTAFQNVADVLRALESDAEAVSAQAEAEKAAAASLELSRSQYQAGAITYLLVLSAEQTYQQTKISLVQAQANRYADTAALFQALGGGWWNRSDVAAATGRGF